MLYKNDMDPAYPRFIRRVKAALFDSFLFAIIMVSVVPTISGIESLQPLIRIILVTIPFIVLEPVLVSFTGGSIGHHIFQIKIRKVDEDVKLSLIRSIIRYIIKIFLGFLSIIFIIFTRKHQAIHDYIAGSIVVLKNPKQHQKTEVLEENSFIKIGYKYPHLIQRLLIPLVYIFIFNILLSIPLAILISDSCNDANKCSPIDQATETGIGILFILIVITFFFKGLSGKLYGCRRKKIKLYEHA